MHKITCVSTSEIYLLDSPYCPTFKKSVPFITPTIPAPSIAAHTIATIITTLYIIFWATFPHKNTALNANDTTRYISTPTLSKKIILFIISRYRTVTITPVIYAHFLFFPSFTPRHFIR